jgi:hypothetical protein
MPSGKRWCAEECEALARCWINVSEDVGSADLKGTDQSGEVFWRRVIESLGRVAPPDSVGRYHNRGKTALMTQWTDKIGREVRKFNKSLLKVYSAQMTGVTEEQKVNVAVSITMGKTDAPAYRFKDYDANQWIYYRAWLVLRDHVMFRPPTPRVAVTVDEEEESFEQGANDQPNDGVPDNITTEASRLEEMSNVTGDGGRRGPGPGKRKTKTMELQAFVVMHTTESIVNYHIMQDDTSLQQGHNVFLVPSSQRPLKHMKSLNKNAEGTFNVFSTPLLLACKFLLLVFNWISECIHKD